MEIFEGRGKRRKKFHKPPRPAFLKRRQEVQKEMWPIIEETENEAAARGVQRTSDAELKMLLETHFVDEDMHQLYPGQQKQYQLWKRQKSYDPHKKLHRHGKKWFYCTRRHCYVVRTGPRGGKYILKNRQKRYISSRTS